MLKELPKTLDETYERILRDIHEANRDHAHRLLQCLAVAVRPLRIAELAEVLAVDFRTTCRGESSKLNTEWRWEDQQDAVLSICSSLISVVDEEGSQIVQFSHFSVKEFLTSSRITGSSADISPFRILLESAHTVLAKACLAVLLRLGGVVDEHNVEDNFPLARYAAEHWVDHARFENVSSHVREGMEDLFDPDKPYFGAWLQVYDIDIRPVSDPHFYLRLQYFDTRPLKASLPAIPLYYAALCGFHELAEQLIIKYPQQVNATSGYFVSPLGVALQGGHLKCAQVLLERGADVDVQANCDYTPLLGASCTGHSEIVQWLLSHRANPNHRGKIIGWISLHGAAFYGHVEVSRLLLQYKADVNARDNRGRTPLHIASQCDQVDVARLLLEHGVDVNAQDKKGRTAFQVASDLGYHDVAKLVSDHGSE